MVTFFGESFSNFMGDNWKRQKGYASAFTSKTLGEKKEKLGKGMFWFVLDLHYFLIFE